MTGDYLWDKSGPADPEVVRLEALLSPFAQPDPAPRFGWPAEGVPVRRSRASMPIVAAAAAAVIALVTFAWTHRPDTAAAWEITRVTGAPVVESRPMGERADLKVGTWLETRADGRATIAIGDIGQVQVEPQTRLRRIDGQRGDYRLQLASGTMHALIWSPPGQFSVETPTSTAVDLGCAYTMTVDEDGTGEILVTSGWVGFAWRGREAFIPAGAACRTRPALGPGTPFFDDVSQAFRASIDAVDTDAGSAAQQGEALDRVLAEARPRDAFTLWHLLSRVTPDERARVFDRLAQLAPPPVTVTREGIRQGRRDMLDQWWDNLGLGSTNWWRVWEQQWRQN